jgi:flagellar basal body-associated protein FliL
MPPAGEIALVIIIVLICVAAVAYVGYMQVGNFVNVLTNYRRAKAEKRKRTEVEISV